METMLKDAVRAYVSRCLDIERSRKDFYRSFMGTVEKPFLETIMKISCGSQLRAARILGVNRNTLHEHLKRLKINYKNYR
jgi:DNA-binding protein Fis